MPEIGHPLTVAPQDVAAEEAVLGAVLLNDAQLDVVLIDAGLRAEHFYRPSNGAIFAAMVGLHDAGEPVDRLTVLIELKRRRTPHATPADVDALSAAAPVVGNASTYARRVVETATLRKKRTAAYGILEAVAAEDTVKIAEAEALLEDREASARSLSPERFGEVTIRAIRGGETRASWPWPLERLNALSGGGLRRSQFTVLGAWPKMGKSVLVDGILIATAQHRASTHLYLNEMSAEERGMRLASNLCDIDFGAIYAGKLTESEAGKVEAVMAHPPFGVTECAGWTAKEIARDIIRRDWDVCAVDILHEIEYDDEGDLRAMASLFARTAKRTRAHVIGTVHFNEKRAEGGELPRPVVRDILGSGHFKRAADYVMFLHREQDEEGIMDDQGYVWFALGRNTRQGGAPIKFRGDRQRVEPW